MIGPSCRRWSAARMKIRKSPKQLRSAKAELCRLAGAGALIHAMIRPRAGRWPTGAGGHGASE